MVVFYLSTPTTPLKDAPRPVFDNRTGDFRSVQRWPRSTWSKRSPWTASVLAGLNFAEPAINAAEKPAEGRRLGQSEGVPAQNNAPAPRTESSAPVSTVMAEARSL